MTKNQLDFVVIGPFKTGTTWIYNYLSHYQQIALPTRVKETFFFDKKFHKDINWYYSHFSQLDSSRKVGEIAPSYFHSTEASKRIYKFNPRCKIIVTLREPVSRILSYYLHMRRTGAIKPETSLIESIPQKKVLLETSRYYSHLSRWIDTFGSENVKVLFFKELTKSPENFAQNLCKQLDIDLENPDIDTSQKVNASQTPINYSLSRIIYSSVKLLHNLGFHEVVEFGKNLGIKNLIFSKRANKIKLSQKEFESIFNLVKKETMLLETDLNLDLSDWKEIWQQQGIKIN